MKAMVLFSGGIDSTTCLGMAVEKYGPENVIALYRGLLWRVLSLLFWPVPGFRIPVPDSGTLRALTGFRSALCSKTSV